MIARRSTLRGLLVVGALGAAAVLWHAVAPLCLTVSAAILTFLAARRDRWLVRIAMLALALRVAAAFAAYMLTLSHLPALQPLVHPPIEGHRFLIVSDDAGEYHRIAVAVVAAWRQGTEFPPSPMIDVAPEYTILTACVYAAFGPNPLNPILLNCLFSALTVVVGYRLADRLGGSRVARPAAILIALWPSAVLWSTQLLRDAANVGLLAVVLYLTVCLMDPPPIDGLSRLHRGRRWAADYLGLFVSALCLYWFRHYILELLTPISAVGIAGAVVPLRRASGSRLLPATATTFVLVLAVLSGRAINIRRLCEPASPHLGHYNLGVKYQRAGDIPKAQAEYERALTLSKDFPPALKALRILAIQHGHHEIADAYVTRVPPAVPDDLEARAVTDPDRKPPPNVPPNRNTGASVDEARSMNYRHVLALLGRLRAGFTRTGGHSLIDRDVTFRSYGEVLRYMPRALANALLAPYPSRWFETGGATGAFRILAIVEMSALYALVVPMAIGAGISLWRGSVATRFVLLSGISMALLLGLVVNNVGTLFRLRLEPLLPLFIAAAFGWVWLRDRWDPSSRACAPN